MDIVCYIIRFLKVFLVILNKYFWGFKISIICLKYFVCDVV